MKFKNIVTFFGVALVVSVTVRILQIVYTIDAATGFFKLNAKSDAFMMIMVMLLAVGATAGLSFTAHRCPEKPPEVNPFLSISPVVLGLSIFYEILTESFAPNIPLWQIVLLKIGGVLSAGFFFSYAASGVLKFKYPRVMAIFPAIYWIFRLICLFMSVSSLALISDNVLLMAYYGASLLFMVSFAKLLCGVKDDYGFRKLLASGLTSIILCATDSIPRILLKLMGRASYLHGSVTSTYTVVAAGVFIALFVFFHFSKGNLSEKEHKPVVFMPDDGSNSFYFETTDRKI